MKRIILILAAMAATCVQAQVCKVSATKNNGKVIQISVNLDSLEGKTLVTTVSHVQNNVVLKLAYEDNASVDTNCVIAREDSILQKLRKQVKDTLAIAEVRDTFTVAEVNDTVQITEGKTDSNQPTAKKSTVIGGFLDMFGLGSVTSLVSGVDSDSHYEEYAKKLAKDLTEADSTKYIQQYKQRKWKWLDKHKSYSTLELSGIFGKDFGDSEGDEKINAEDYGMDPKKAFNLGGSVKFSQVFVPGTYDAQGEFTPNRLNFAWSIGGLFAIDCQKDYGWSTDFMAKIGIQAGNGITLGADALIGAGTTPYAIYSSDYINYRSVLHNQWCFKYGAQVWISSNFSGNTYTSLFARIVHSVAPSSIYHHPTDQYWYNTLIDFDKGSWQVGFAVGYKFGYNPDLKSRRLQASVSAGYSLTGKNKAPEVLIEIEKINRVSPVLDFSYGVGFGQSCNKNYLQSFTINGGWFFRLKPEHKFGYLIKLYAGAGEYMVGKELKTSDGEFEMVSNVQKLCLKGGVNLGGAFRFGCNTLSASCKIGYHYGFASEYKGYEIMKDEGLRGFDVVPMIGYTLNF